LIVGDDISPSSVDIVNLAIPDISWNSDRFLTGY